MIKEPGPGGMRLQHVPLDMSFAKTFATPSPEAYERLLMDAVRGNASLFMRRDEVEAAWSFIDPIREAWAHRRRAAAPLRRRNLGPGRLHRADRARRPHLERGIRMTNPTFARRDFADGAASPRPSPTGPRTSCGAAIAARGMALLVVSGGSTPLRYFEALVDARRSTGPASR